MIARTLRAVRAWLFGQRPPFVLESIGRDRMLSIENGRTIEVIGELLMSGFVIYAASVAELQGDGPIDERTRLPLSSSEKERVVANIKRTAREGYYRVHW